MFSNGCLDISADTLISLRGSCTNRIYQRSPIESEKSQLEGKRIMPETNVENEVYL